MQIDINETRIVTAKVFGQMQDRRKIATAYADDAARLNHFDDKKQKISMALRSLLMPYMTAAGFASSFTGTDMLSVRAKALGLLHGEDRYPKSKSGVTALIRDLEIFSGINRDDTLAGRDSALSNWLKNIGKIDAAAIEPSEQERLLASNS